MERQRGAKCNFKRENKMQAIFFRRACEPEPPFPGSARPIDDNNGTMVLFGQSDELTPQVIQSAKIVLMNPGNQASQEHFDLLKKQWLDNMEKLRDLVDEATDTGAFIKAQGTPRAPP